MEIKVYSAQELLKIEFTSRDVIAAELESAARILRENQDGSRDDSAAWRVADAGLELRRLIEKTGAADVPGVHEPTGMGAFLPSDRTKETA